MCPPGWPRWGEASAYVSATISPAFFLTSSLFRCMQFQFLVQDSVCLVSFFIVLSPSAVCSTSLTRVCDAARWVLHNDNLLPRSLLWRNCKHRYRLGPVGGVIPRKTNIALECAKAILALPCALSMLADERGWLMKPRRVLAHVGIAHLRTSTKLASKWQQSTGIIPNACSTSLRTTRIQTRPICSV